MGAAFDLDDLGAEIGEVAAGEGAGPAHGEVQHADAAERAGGRGAVAAGVEAVGQGGAFEARPVAVVGREAVALAPMGGGEDLLHGGNGAHGDAVLALAVFQHGAGGELGDGGHEDLVELVGGGHAQVGGFEAGVFREIGQADEGAEALPLLGGEGGDADPAIVRGEDGLRIDGPVAVDAAAAGGRRTGEGAGAGVFGEGEEGFVDAELDALGALAGAAGQQGGHGGDEGGGAGDYLRGVALGQDGGAFGGAEGVGDAAKGLEQGV